MRVGPCWTSLYCDPFSVPSSRMVGSEVTSSPLLWSLTRLGSRAEITNQIVSFFLLSVRVPLLVRLLLLVLSPVPSLSCFCTFQCEIPARTSFVKGQSDSLLYNDLAVPLLRSVPSRCCRSFHPFLRCRSFWAGLLLLHVVLAGLLPHFATIATRLTKHLSTSFHLWCLLRSHAGYALGQLHQVFSPGRALLCRLFFNIMWAFFKLCRPTRPLTQAEPSPSDGQHACSRLSPLALDWSLEEQATFTLPPCALWEAATWFGWCLFEFLRRCFQLVFYIQCYSDIFNPFVADRRATARTTETLSHAASSLKKTRNSSRSTFHCLAFWLVL